MFARMSMNEFMEIGMFVLILMACGVFSVGGAAAGGLKWLK